MLKIPLLNLELGGKKYLMHFYGSSKITNFIMIIICMDHICAANLPQDGISSDLQQLETEEDSVPMPPQGPPSVCTESSVSNEETEICQTNSFLPIPQGVRLEEDGIRQTINGCYALDWPELSLRGINEFSTEGLATLALPTLFPFDRGDPTCKQRHITAHLTIEQLRDMVGRLDSTNLISRIQISRYVSKLKGSNQYWYARYEDLKALFQQKGSPTIFWMVSSADNYWPQLYSLMPLCSTTPASRVNSVIAKAQLTDWYFHSRQTDFVQHWLRDGVDAEWYWYRFDTEELNCTTSNQVKQMSYTRKICTKMSGCIFANSIPLSEAVMISQTQALIL